MSAHLSEPDYDYQGVLFPVGDVPSMLDDGWEYHGSFVRTPAADPSKPEWSEQGAPFVLVCYRRPRPSPVSIL